MSTFSGVVSETMARVRRMFPPRHARSAEAWDIPIRNRHFDVGSASRPRYWHPAGPGVSIFFDNLSIFFPPGERFFMHSVKAFRHHAPSGGPLDQAVRAFLAQEAYHGREHRAYNARLDALGYPAAAMESRVSRLLDVVTLVIPPRLQLAATCALEHYTAFMGHHVLVDERILAGADREFAELWKWHAVEENEHKSVAFDLFRQAGGTSIELAVAMMLATTIFWAKVAEQQWRMMHAAGLAFDSAEWRRFFAFIFHEPGNLKLLHQTIFTFLKPGFHPDDHDAGPAIAAWRRAAEHERDPAA